MCQPTAEAAPIGGEIEAEDAATAKSKMQLPPSNTAKYRLEFDYSSVKDNVSVARGEHAAAEFFEPHCKDYPAFGDGSASQVVVDGADITITAIWDLSGPVPIKIF
jgi:hypothetical protein